MPTHLTRVWFQSRNCKQCPIELTIKPLWANGKEGFFLSAKGTKLKPAHSPAHQKKGSKAYNGKRGQVHPNFRKDYGYASYHRLMAYTYATEPCPIYFDSKGQPYKGIVHHVIENPYDIRMDNLMGWLTYKQHSIADKRRRALEQTLPDMYCVQTSFLKQLQDPRQTSDEKFNEELKRLQEKYRQRRQSMRITCSWQWACIPVMARRRGST